MNKKIIAIIAVIAVILIAGVGIFLFTNRGGSVGLDNNIKNEDKKEGAGTVNLDSSKVLVAYFSETGNTQKLAKLISDEVGGDFRRIETVKEYPQGKDLFDYTKNERDNDERPELKDIDVNIDDYSGKTIVTFNTHEGSEDGGTYETIKELEPNATVLDGLIIHGGDMESDQKSAVKDWLKGLGFYE